MDSYTIIKTKIIVPRQKLNIYYNMYNVYYTYVRPIICQSILMNGILFLKLFWS